MSSEHQIILASIQAYLRLAREFVSKRDDMLKKLGTPPSDMKYVVATGSKVINHIFNLVLGTSQCVETAFKIAKHGIYYYLEFIGQIGEDDHQYLKLTPKDAVVFVYKKTIDNICARPTTSSDILSDRGFNTITACTNLLSQAIVIYRDSDKVLTLCGVIVAELNKIDNFSSQVVTDLQWAINFLSLVKEEHSSKIVSQVLKKTLCKPVRCPLPKVVIQRLEVDDINVSNLLAEC